MKTNNKLGNILTIEKEKKRSIKSEQLMAVLRSIWFRAPNELEGLAHTSAICGRWPQLRRAYLGRVGRAAGRGHGAEDFGSVVGHLHRDDVAAVVAQIQRQVARLVRHDQALLGRPVHQRRDVDRHLLLLLSIQAFSRRHSSSLRKQKPRRLTPSVGLTAVAAGLVGVAEACEGVARRMRRSTCAAFSLVMRTPAPLVAPPPPLSTVAALTPTPTPPPAAAAVDAARSTIWVAPSCLS